jgi:hypothetical protein
MVATDAARAAPAATGHNPRITDRHSGAIEIIPTSTAGYAAATDAARRLGSDWPGVLALHVEVVNTWQRRHQSNFDGSAEEGRRAAARALAAMPPRRKAGAP